MTPLVNAALANALRSRYALIRQTGEGGMATGYLTEDYDFSNESNWDVLPDGRFLMVKSAPYVGREIRLAFNWIERLDARSK